MRWLVFGFIVILAIQVCWRITFPWDMYSWPESPFMTDMMKLSQHQSLHASPKDGNSMVYSPGLAYLTYAALKPLGLQLDIRFCRLVTVLLGAAAAAFAGLAMIRFLRLQGIKFSWLRAMTLSIACLAVFKNALADVPHPDNLHAMLILGVFCLTYAAIETRSFDVALLTVIVAGCGVLSKQTNALCFLGPACVFAWLNLWGWRRWFGLVAVGGMVFAGALALMWHSEYARFYTYDLLKRNQIVWSQFERLPGFFLTVDRGLFLLVALALRWLWRGGPASRRYLTCWLCIGFWSVAPNLSAYVKINGTWNNLNLFEVWGVLAVWPWFAATINNVRVTDADFFPPWLQLFGNRGVMIVCSTILFLYLFPTKLPMRPDNYQFCEQVESDVRNDLAAGKRILVSDGTEFLLRAGSKEIPIDRCRSIIELNAGGAGALSGMRDRIRARYYDRIYLIMGILYGDELLSEIDKNYVVERSLPEPSTFGVKLPLGIQPSMNGAKVLIPRR